MSVLTAPAGQSVWPPLLQASLQLNIAEQAFRVGFLSRDLQQSQQWDFSSANPDHSLVSEVSTYAQLHSCAMIMYHKFMRGQPVEKFVK